MIHADIVVAGGGPAGAAFALRLARLGRRAVIVERRPRAAHGFAESLAPGVAVHLQTLGIATPESWSVPAKIVAWNGTTTIVEGEQRIVDRAAFDAALLRAAADAGVVVLQPATIDAFERRDGRWHIHAGGEAIDAQILADATGRAGLLRGVRRSPATRRFALRARWDRIAASREMRVAELSDGWIWGAPRQAHGFDAVLSAGRPLRGDEVPAIAQRSALFAFIDTPPDACHRCEATPFVAAEPMTPASILVGDAACAIDPLSSSGLQKALGGAIAASIAVETVIADRERAVAAIEFYTQKIHAAAARHAEWASAHDGGSEPRAAMIGPECAVALHPSARILDAPAIVGDRIEQRRVVETPRGDRVAWIGVLDVAVLLEPLREGITAGDLARAWRLAPRDALAAMRWLVANEVLIPAARG